MKMAYLAALYCAVAILSSGSASSLMSSRHLVRINTTAEVFGGESLKVEQLLSD